MKTIDTSASNFKILSAPLYANILTHHHVDFRDIVK